MTKREERLWLQGFAVATATIWRCDHDAQMVEMVMSENNITVAELRAAGTNEGDIEMIEMALALLAPRDGRRSRRVKDHPKRTATQRKG